MLRTSRSALIAAAVCAGALAILAVLAYYVNPLGVADARALEWMSGFEYSAPGGPARALAFLADPVPVVVLLGVASAFALARRRPEDAVAAVAVVAGACITSQILKHLLAHPRFHSFLEVQPDLTAFPSGHVTAAAATAIAFAWVAPPNLRKPVAVFGAVYVAAVGLSMLVLRRHLPSDVLGGALVALIWGLGVLAAYLRLVPKLRREEIPRPGQAAGASFRSDCV